jgi:AraC-like DNA-binding protein
MGPDGIEIVLAPQELAPFVRRYMYINRRLEAPMVVRPKPTGYTYFSNMFGGPSVYYVIVDGETFPQASQWHLPGQIVDHDITVHHPVIHQALYCELSATCLYRLFGVPGEQTTGKAPALFELAPDLEGVARRHFVRGPESSRDEHIAEANAFFAELAERAGSGDALVEEAVALFEAANGAVRVAEICERLNTDPRQLNRRFNHIVGVNPKFFGQVLQINWVVGLLYFSDGVKLSELAQAAGFHDQSHFHRAMKRFFDEGPREFLDSDHVLFKAFLGASRRFGPSSSALD